MVRGEDRRRESLVGVCVCERDRSKKNGWESKRERKRGENKLCKERKRE